MQVNGICNLASEPQIVSDKMVTFSVAVNKGKDEKKEVSFYSVKVCGWSADIAKTFKKGDFIMLAGELKEEKWNDKKTGDKRSKVVIIAYNCALIKHSNKQSETSQDEPF